MLPTAYCLKCLMAPKTATRSRSVGRLTRVCFQHAVTSKGGDLFLVSLWLQRAYPGSHGVGVIPVEARRHSTPSPISFLRPGLRLGLCALYTRGRSSPGIYQSSTFDGGGVFSTSPGFRRGWLHACAIDA